MIIYFADRQLNILGQASTGLPGGLSVVEDNKTEDVETGVAVFECKIPFDKGIRAQVEEYAEVGNYILRSNDDETELYTIIEAEIDTKNQEVYIYAEDDGMDLLNEVVGAYEADKAYPISHYINKYAAGAGFQIGINEAASLTRKLVWDGESTAAERIASVATQFDGCEVSYSFAVNGLTVTEKYINIYKERGKEIGIPLRLNEDVDRIVTIKSIANLATALQCTGGTPEEAEEPITLSGYKYDDGDFYVDGAVLKSRMALKRWSRYLWKNEESQKMGGHIVKQFSFDTTEQSTLCAHAITELKKIRDMEVNYEVDISKYPPNLKIGDRVNIVDDAGGLYLSARLLKLETSVADDSHKATLGEFLIKSSGISQRVMDLAAQFAATSITSTKALLMANSAKTDATAAQAAADAAAAQAAQTQADLEELANSLNQATELADDAEEEVNTIEERVATLETTVNNAQIAADNAQLAAETAQDKADEAAQSAAQAIADAADADAAATLAQESATEATVKAEVAQTTANEAKAEAATAQETADAAKLDAEQAQKNIDELASDLETVSNTMTADYARKTDLTEATASLETRISQNAAEISSTAAAVQIIDETVNNAQEQAQAAQATADTAKNQAEKAEADALAAQTAADNAATAAANAQSEADMAKAAAAAAQNVADKAESDLAKAKADLETVSSRIDATEEEIEAAQTAVTAAQAAADKAKTDADAAATQAANAQTAAAAAVAEAEEARTTANNAANAAAVAQGAANDASEIAAEAQQIANNALLTATTAQEQADTAAQAAADAQTVADAAKTKAEKAETDLATARQNLEAVTSRVDATEADVEAAQAAVITAQEAAERAQEEAETAQAAADAAKADASAAQTVADNAKAAADAAQQAADDAQKAADDAQAAVDALAVRVTTAETKITQNTEQIALMATKTEVTETLGGYYTKSQADSAITVSADAVKSEVSSTYATKQEVSNIKIGGRNLVRDSAMTKDTDYWSFAGGICSYGFSNGYCEIYRTETNGSRAFNSQSTNVNPLLKPDDISGGTFTLSAEIKLLDGHTITDRSTLFYRCNTTDLSSGFQEISLRLGGADSEWKKIYSTFTFGNYNFDGACQVCLALEDTVDVGLCIRNIKLEKGHKATDWTQAPEDIQVNIDSAKLTADQASESATTANERITTAETLIQQLSNCISMLVIDENGESLMTQTENGWTFSMKETTEAVASLTDLLETLQQESGSTQSAVDTLQQAVIDHGKALEYVNISTYENEPCIELGESDSDFKLFITNTRIMFMNGANVPTYINTNGLVTQDIEVKGEIVQGGYVMLNTSDGGWGLLWKGVNS